jgi:hypothetical protein
MREKRFIMKSFATWKCDQVDQGRPKPEHLPFRDYLVPMGNRFKFGTQSSLRVPGMPHQTRHVESCSDQHELFPVRKTTIRSNSLVRRACGPRFAIVSDVVELETFLDSSVRLDFFLWFTV